MHILPRGVWLFYSATWRPNGAVVKAGAVNPELLKFSGKAHVFDHQEDAMRGIMNSEVKAGEVVVIAYEGPKGGPGNAGNAQPDQRPDGHGSW